MFFKMWSKCCAIQADIDMCDIDTYDVDIDMYDVDIDTYEVNSDVHGWTKKRPALTSRWLLLC